MERGSPREGGGTLQENLRNGVHECSYPRGTGTSAQNIKSTANTPSLYPAIVSADHYSRTYEASKHPDEGFKDETSRARAEALSRRSAYEKIMDFGKEQRYKIVGGSWVASMAIALGLVGRNPYLSTAQKLVQARVYAQGLTVAVLIATAIFEIGDRNKEEGRYETVKVVDPDDPTHKHIIEKKIHKEEYAGEDQWKGESFYLSFFPVFDLETATVGLLRKTKEVRRADGP